MPVVMCFRGRKASVTGPCHVQLHHDNHEVVKASLSRCVYLRGRGRCRYNARAVELSSVAFLGGIASELLGDQSSVSQAAWTARRNILKLAMA